MKYFFVEPVCYGFFYTPVMGVPTLLGILEDNNQEAKYIGLNNDFIRKCFDEDFYSCIFKKRENIFSIDINCESKEIQETIKKLRDTVSSKTKKMIYDKNKNLIAKRIFETKKYYSNEILFEFANKRIHFLPQQLCIADLVLTNKLLSAIGENEEHTFSINLNLLKFYFDKKLSPIDDYIDEQAEKIISEKPDCIGISISTDYHFLSGLLLAYKIKKKSNIHINIGGDFFNENYKRINNLSEFYEVFFDSISIEDNTKTVTDILKYINKEIPIDEVSNILYFENGFVKRSKFDDYIAFNELPFQSFSGYDFESLIIPKLILPLQTSNSCYWKRCIFCECCGLKKYETKSVEKVVDEIEFLSKKYNTKYFCFWDNSMHPVYISSFADLLIEKKIKIKFSVYARLEPEFDYKLLKKLKKAGCIKIHWGLDSANQRVLDYIKKGITIENSEKVLAASKKAGIYNFVYVIMGHPTETKNEMDDLYSYLKRNSKNINNLYLIAQVFFNSYSKISEFRTLNKSLIQTTIEERVQFKNFIKQKFSLITTEEYNSLQTSIPMLLYVEKYGNGVKARFNKMFSLFMNSKPRLKSIYLKYKLKQIEKENNM